MTVDRKQQCLCSKIIAFVTRATRRSPTFSTDDSPNFCPPARYTGFSDGSQSDAIPFILLNPDIPTDFNVKSMIRIHFHMRILHRDPSGDVERRKRIRLLTRRGFVDISARCGSRELNFSNAYGEIRSDPLRVNGAGGGDVLNAALNSLV